MTIATITGIVKLVALVVGTVIVPLATLAYQKTKRKEVEEKDRAKLDEYVWAAIHAAEEMADTLGLDTSKKKEDFAIQFVMKQYPEADPELVRVLIHSMLALSSAYLGTVGKKKRQIEKETSNVSKES